jgi:hypothetical protein
MIGVAIADMQGHTGTDGQPGGWSYGVFVFFHGLSFVGSIRYPQLNVVLFRGPVRTRQRAAMPLSQVTLD